MILTLPMNKLHYILDNYIFLYNKGTKIHHNPYDRYWLDITCNRLYYKSISHFHFDYIWSREEWDYHLMGSHSCNLPYFLCRHKNLYFETDSFLSVISFCHTLLNLLINRETCIDGNSSCRNIIPIYSNFDLIPNSQKLWSFRNML